jgi:hypothetical protein
MQTKKQQKNPSIVILFYMRLFRIQQPTDSHMGNKFSH